ncbi:hypothetical protein Vretifemale_21026, partial [Volvox reticuliferus]
ESHGEDGNKGAELITKPTIIQAVSTGRVLAPFAASMPSESHMVVWAPSLRDPRVMPFLGQHLKDVLLRGSDSPWTVRKERGAEGGRVSVGEHGGERSGGSWWDSEPLVLYRGMVHPD